MNHELARAMASAVLEGDHAGALALVDYLREHEGPGAPWRLYVVEEQTVYQGAHVFIAPPELPAAEVIDLVEGNECGYWGHVRCEATAWTTDARYQHLWDFFRPDEHEDDYEDDEEERRAPSAGVLEYLARHWANAPEQTHEVKSGRERFLRWARGALKEAG